MNTSNLKPFNLAEFKSNEETPVVHEDGNRATIIIPPNPEKYKGPVAAFFTDGHSDVYRTDGTHSRSRGQLLFFAPSKKVVPLTLEDVDRMRWLKTTKDATEYHAVVQCFKGGVELGGSRASWSFDGLMTCGWLYAEKVTGPWHRCEKEVEV